MSSDIITTHSNSKSIKGVVKIESCEQKIRRDIVVPGRADSFIIAFRHRTNGHNCKTSG